MDYEPLMTVDADLAVHDRLKPREATMSELLACDFETQASFDEPRPEDRGPPVCRYVPKDEATDFYIEFITPLRGSVIKHGAADTTVDVAGVSAQRLRHINLLLEEPWEVEVAESAGYPVGSEPVKVQVPNPTAYIVQKLLVLSRRPPDDQAKDILYIHDTLLLFGAAHDELLDIWKRVAASLPGKTKRTLLETRAAYCTRTTDMVRDAALIARDTGRSNPPSPEALATVLRVGTAKVFGS